jgi:hypothetical protein
MGDDSIVRPSREEAKRLLAEHAFTTEHGRTIIHTFMGGIGADWDLADALAEVDRATDVGWLDDLTGHCLGVKAERPGRPGTYRTVRFDVPLPEGVYR